MWEIKIFFFGFFFPQVRCVSSEHEGTRFFISLKRRHFGATRSRSILLRQISERISFISRWKHFSLFKTKTSAPWEINSTQLPKTPFVPEPIFFCCVRTISRWILFESMHSSLTLTLIQWFPLQEYFQLLWDGDSVHVHYSFKSISAWRPFKNTCSRR